MSGVAFTPKGLLIGANAAIGTNALCAVDASNADDAIAFPQGTTAERPTGEKGMIRFNTSLNNFEGFIAAWAPFGGGIEVQNAGTLVNTTSILDFTKGANVILTVTDDHANGRINVFIDALNSGGGGGGGSINVEANGSGTISSVANLNLVNTSTINVNVTSYQSGTTANLAFKANVAAITALTEANVATALGVAEAAYAQANAAETDAQTGIAAAAAANVTGQTAITLAGVALADAEAAYGEANSAFALATTAEATALAANVVAQTAITIAASANSLAQSAYTEANVAAASVGAAYAQANAAYTEANLAYQVANSDGIYAYGSVVQANTSNLNFINTSTINAFVTANGTSNTNVSFSINTAALNLAVAANTSTYQNGTLVVDSANNNFNNTATINVTGTSNGTQSNLAFSVNTSAIQYYANNYVAPVTVLGSQINGSDWTYYAVPNVGIGFVTALSIQANTANCLFDLVVRGSSSDLGQLFLAANSINQNVYTITYPWYYASQNSSANGDTNFYIGIRNDLALNTTFTLNTLNVVQMLINANIYALAVAQSVILFEQFTATTNQSVFNLVNSPPGANYVSVSLNGIEQNPTTHFTLVGNVLTFTSNTTAGDQIGVQEFMANYTGAPQSVWANGTLVLGNSGVNFINTVSVNVAVTANGTVYSNAGFNINTTMNLVSLNVSANIANVGNIRVTQNTYTGNITVIQGANLVSLNVSANIANVGNISVTQNTYTGNITVIQGANVTGTLNVAGGANVLGSMAVGTYAGVNGTILIQSVNGTSILLQSQGTDYGTIGNPNNQVWSLGYTATVSNTQAANVLSWGGAAHAQTGPWVVISGGTSVAQTNSAFVGSGSGRAMLWLKGDTTNKDAMVVLANDTNYGAGYMYGTNVEFRLYSTNELTFYSNGVLSMVMQNSGANITFPAISTSAIAANVTMTTAGIMSRTSSSCKGKLNITPLGADFYNKVLNFEPVTFNSNTQVHIHDDPDVVVVGLIAEQVCEHTTMLGANDSVDYRAVGIMLLGVVKEQQKTIETLKTRVTALEMRLDT